MRSVTPFTRGTFVCALAARRENVTFPDIATVSTRMAVAAVKPTAKTLPTRFRGRGSVVEGSSEGTEL